MSGNNRTTLLPGANCCDKQPCRRSYADYGTYLKKRTCVGPSDLCSLERMIQDGKIPVGSISHSGDRVSIDHHNVSALADDSMVLSANNTVRVAGESETHIGAGSTGRTNISGGSITLTAGSADALSEPPATLELTSGTPQSAKLSSGLSCDGPVTGSAWWGPDGVFKQKVPESVRTWTAGHFTDWPTDDMIPSWKWPSAIHVTGAENYSPVLHSGSEPLTIEVANAAQSFTTPWAEGELMEFSVIATYPPSGPDGSYRLKVKVGAEGDGGQTSFVESVWTGDKHYRSKVTQQPAYPDSESDNPLFTLTCTKDNPTAVARFALRLTGLGKFTASDGSDGQERQYDLIRIA